LNSVRKKEVKWKGKKEVVRNLFQICTKTLSLSGEHKLSRTLMMANKRELRGLFHNVQDDVHDEISS